jgi:hypothetical protein
MNTDFSMAGDRKTTDRKIGSTPCPYIFLSSNFSVIVPLLHCNSGASFILHPSSSQRHRPLSFPRLLSTVYLFFGLWTLGRSEILDMIAHFVAAQHAVQSHQYLKQLADSVFVRATPRDTGMLDARVVQR